MSKRLTLYIVLIIIAVIFGAVYYVEEAGREIKEDITQEVYDGYRQYGLTDEESAFNDLAVIIEVEGLVKIDLEAQPFDMYEINDKDAFALLKDKIEACKEINLVYKLIDKKTQEVSYHIDYLSNENMRVIVSYTESSVSKVIAFEDRIETIKKDEGLTKTILFNK